MDFKQLTKDILKLNFSSYPIRWNKLKAVLKRKFLLSEVNFGTKKNIKEIPIIINNRNRLTYLLQLTNWLERNGFNNIYIIDNDSTYPPLLVYYSKTNYKVFKLNDNVGHLALWKTGIVKQFESDYYIYSDPDVLPIDECPTDAIVFLMKNLVKYSTIEKIGLGLKTDDLQDHYSDKKKVIDWEKKIVGKEIEKDIFDARVDTTFALYRPYTNGAKWVPNAYRTGGKYMMHHLPWYENTSNPLEEDKYYKEHILQGASHWIYK